MMRSNTKGSPRERDSQKASVTRRISISATLAAVLILAPLSAALAGQLGPAADRCLGCHSMPALSKTMANGEKMSLHIPKEAFTDSVHAMLGCAGCHRDVDPAAHPSMRPYESVRDYTLAKADVCKTCHSAKYEQYESSVHASLVEAGNPDAPVCASCHDVHAQKKAAEQATLSGAICKQCHDDIFQAYQGSVHGKARAESQHSQAPICSDCHQAHDVTAVSYGDRLKNACLGCHEGAQRAHKDWLPNSGLHLNAIACPVCHSPKAGRAVDLRLYDRNTGELVSETLEDPKFAALAREIDSNGDGLDPLELWKLVRAANREGVDTSITLRGRLEVPHGPDAHKLELKAEAVRRCDTCHQQGADPFKSVSISVTGSDGRRISYAADEETLTSVASVDSVGNFYTAGGTRIRLLDGLLVLAVLSGIGIPLTHMTVRKWFKSKN